MSQTAPATDDAATRAAYRALIRAIETPDPTAPLPRQLTRDEVSQLMANRRHDLVDKARDAGHLDTLLTEGDPQ